MSQSKKVVNIARNKLASDAQKRANRSSTHIRIKKTTKFDLEKWMRRHHAKTYDEAIKRLMEGN